MIALMGVGGKHEEVAQPFGISYLFFCDLVAVFFRPAFFGPGVVRLASAHPASTHDPAGALCRPRFWSGVVAGSSTGAIATSPNPCR
jgi:hypothetical protein